MSEACLHTREREIFGLLVARVVQKVYGKTGPFSNILCGFFRAIRRYIDHADRSRNERKSGLNRPWLERAVCWKRQEVSGTLITRWNEASWALPVLALKSNYLDRWLNDCLILLHFPRCSR